MNKKILSLALALALFLGLVACGVDSNVVEVPHPDEITLEFLKEHGENKGTHEWEGDIYLQGAYVFAVRENGKVQCILQGAANVIDVNYNYVGPDRIPRSDGILVLNLHWYLMVGNSRDGWKALHK